MKESSIFKGKKLINSKTDGLNCLINTKQTSRCSHYYKQTTNDLF